MPFHDATSHRSTRCLGAARYRDLDAKQKQEGIIEWVFNTDCYTQAVLKIKKDCHHLDTAARQQLAFDSTVCFMREHRFKLPKCARQVAPNLLLDCINEINKEAQSRNIYVEFYSNIHR
jgi:hypothetical protein